MSKRTVRRALERSGNRRRMWREVIIAAALSGGGETLDYAMSRYDRANASITLLNRRLSRMPRFRILWWNVAACLAASGLLVWFAIICLSEWANAAPA